MIMSVEKMAVLAGSVMTSARGRGYNRSYQLVMNSGMLVAVEIGLVNVIPSPRFPGRR
jgi:hypothetical protein